MKRIGMLGLLTVALGCGSNGGNLPSCKDGQIPEQQGSSWTCVDALTPPAVNTLAQAQLDCQAGQVPVYGQGGWACGTVSSTSGGDITSVKTPAGSGLTGGGDTGTLTLGVDFGGNGVATTVSRSDHTHDFLSLSGLPAGFADLVDNDALGALQCSNQQVPRFNSVTAAWECWTPSTSSGSYVETDPTVNQLAKSAVDGCTYGQVPMRTANGWSCLTPHDSDTLASLNCSNGQIAQYSVGAGTWGCVNPPQMDPNTVTAVAVAPGLTSARDGGTVSLAVDFATSCASGKVACSDQITAAVTPNLGQVLQQGNDASGQRIQNLGPPVASSDAVNKAYVDALSGGGGGSLGLSVAICCGTGCTNLLPGFNCDSNGPDAGSAMLMIQMPDKRGFVQVPSTGNPVVFSQGAPTTLADGGVTSSNVTLGASCSTGWNVCTQSGFSTAMVTCGSFASSTDPSPWTCGAPPKAYVMVPSMKGILYISGDDTTNEYLDDTGRSTSPASVIDCSGAQPLPGPNVKTAVCFR